MNIKKSEELFKEAKTLFPGGVNSPVRAFRAVGGTPLFFVKGDGAYVWDADNNKYIDFCCSWGPLILGHNNPKVTKAIQETAQNGASFGTPTIQENQLGKLILDNHRYLEKIRFVSSGTEATMSGIRLARGYTGRSKIIKFDGCYHGHADSLLVKAGSGLATLGISTSAGVPESFANETIVLPLNNIDLVVEAFNKYKDEIACVIIEPVPANNGLLIQDKTFLKQLREVCTKHNVLLFFDEVISGFRLGFEGASGMYNIKPDIITFGKIIGGGLPVGAYGANEDIMSCISPEGAVYQAGTLSGNPIAMAAGKATLEILLEEEFYEHQNERTNYFVSSLVTHAKNKDYKFNIYNVGSIFWLAFSDNIFIRKASDIDSDSMEHFKKLHKALLERGVYIGPSGFEVGFISSAHTKEVLDESIEIFKESLDVVFS